MKKKNINSLEALVMDYKGLAKGVIDYKKYAYFTVTHHSTAIEGNTLTESQVINLLEYGKPASNKPFVENQMVHDHYKAILFVMELAQNKTPLTPKIIQQIGEKVTYGTGGFVNSLMGTYDISKGEFRLGSVRAGTRSFPDYKEVPKLVDDLCKQVNEAIRETKTFEQKCELAYKIHFDFVSIHPFGDGNGRTSRLLMNYIQAYFNLPLSIVFKQDRIKYINALEATRNQDSMSLFYDFINKQYEKFLKSEIKRF
jgi:Fic family protein